VTGILRVWVCTRDCVCSTLYRKVTYSILNV